MASTILPDVTPMSESAEIRSRRWSACVSDLLYSAVLQSEAVEPQVSTGDGADQDAATSRRSFASSQRSSRSATSHVSNARSEHNIVGLPENLINIVYSYRFVTNLVRARCRRFMCYKDYIVFQIQLVMLSSIERNHQWSLEVQFATHRSPTNAFGYVRMCCFLFPWPWLWFEWPWRTNFT